MECEELRALAPELALGIADGAERARALRHLASCPECQRLLDELSEVTDELLLLGPEREPPEGFESRVLARIRPPRTRRRRLALFRTPLAAVASAAVAVVIVLGTTSDDRRLADQYRQTLAAAHGTYFEAGVLRAPGGRRAGVVFGYRGTPSWIFVQMNAGYRSTSYTGELVLTSGRRTPLHALRGNVGETIPVDLHLVQTVRLVGSRTGAVFEAVMPHAAHMTR